MIKGGTYAILREPHTSTARECETNTSRVEGMGGGGVEAPLHQKSSARTSSSRSFSGEELCGASDARVKRTIKKEEASRSTDGSEKANLSKSSLGLLSPRKGVTCNTCMGLPLQRVCICPVFAASVACTKVTAASAACVFAHSSHF